MIRAVIFDLDGTLVDSLEDLADAVNAALESRGLPTHPVHAYKTFVGEGQMRLIEKVLPPGYEGLRDAVLAEFRRIYLGDPTRKTRPYSGIPDAIADAQRRGLKLAVLSNKPDEPTRKIVERLFAPGTFQVCFGERAGIPRKPDPTSAREVAGRLGVAEAECVFVGDTAIDMKTAKAAGMKALGVLWGFRGREEIAGAGADWIVSHPSEISALLDRG